MDAECITGFVLAGGKSKRMGTDKALLDFGGKPLLVHMLELIRPFCSSIFISGNNPDYQCFDVEVIRDVYQDKGPLSGIFSALTHSNTEWNLLVSVDTPMLSDEFLRNLVLGRNSCECVVPVHASGIEPLVALYNKKLVPVIQEMLETGNYRITDLFSRVETNFWDCNSLLEKYPRLFLNMNRMEDYLSV